VQHVDDGFLQAGDLVEAAAADGLAGNQREPALDQVEPRSAGRGEMQLETGMHGKPLDHRGMLVSPIVYRRSDATPAWDTVVPEIPER
jgi:hypothetical protein